MMTVIIRMDDERDEFGQRLYILNSLSWSVVVYSCWRGEFTADNFGSCFHHSVKHVLLALADAAEPYTY